MKYAPTDTLTVREGDRFDDEITLPLRIICERRPETGDDNRREQLKAMSSRELKEDRKPFRAA